VAIVYSLNNSLQRRPVLDGSVGNLRFGRDASAPATSRTGSRLTFVRENAGADNLSIVVSTSTRCANQKVLPSALFASSRGTGEHPMFFGEE
jgi:hypothetical protein